MYPLARGFGGVAAAAPVAVRVIVGGMMFAHGVDKLSTGPSGFGQFLGAELGLPAGLSSAGSSPSSNSSAERCWSWGCSLA